MIISILILLSFNVYSQSIENEIISYLNSYFNDYDKVEIQSMNNNLNDLEIDYSKPLVKNSDLVLLPMKNKNNGNVSIKRLKVKFYKKVLTANMDIQFGTLLKNQDFSVVLKDVTMIKRELVPVQQDLTNYKAKFSIKKGDLLLSDMIEEIPSVISGEKVIAEIQRGSVLISTDCIARQNGKIGERIDVLTPNNEVIKAKVISKNKVIVE
ncbi:MAG: flagellar basal body P-ring formation chaperone FlgA [Ignavibacterium sp.]|nr:flagellar basal body P-ring formation chaperone FlgA [Ignavibacterium sp.]MDW8374149.1 flagellar basal body P-ring formation chaperone FlgA [Ignavibacteriales bacterium]